MFYEKSCTPFYTSFLSLCSQKGVSPSVAARDSGISSGAPTAWKKGAVPKPAQRQKLCSYFGVTDDVLMGYVQIDEYGTKHISTRIPNIPDASVDELGCISYDLKEKAPAPEGEHNKEPWEATDSSRRLKVLARHLDKIPEETRDRLVKNFEDTIDTYLDAMGIPREGE